MGEETDSTKRAAGDARHVVLAGASGTIGRAAARQLIADGHRVTCLTRRSTSGAAGAGELAEWAGAALVPVDFADAHSVAEAIASASPDTIVSCIASRSGAPDDAWEVDHRVNQRLLAGAQESGTVDHFVLLSAICVQRPHLEFQRAKLAFEAELIACPIDHTIVRPTAFFKSLSGQVERVARGKPFLIFGDGELTRCKPISDADLARFLAECVVDPAKRGEALPIGGPGPAITLKEQGELLFDLVGRPPAFRSVSPKLFDVAASALSLGAPFSKWFAAKAEYARIAKYYATQSMLVLDPETGEYSAEATPEFGRDTLREHYAALLAELDTKSTGPARAVDAQGTPA